MARRAAPRAASLPRLACALAWCLSLGCSGDRYELKQDTGRLVRLDKRTGQVAVVGADSLVRLKDASGPPSPAARREDSLLASPKKWPRDSIPQIGVDSALLVTAYWGDMIHYRIDLTPVPGGMDEALASAGQFQSLFDLFLQDGGGLSVVDAGISRDEIRRVIKPDGTCCQGLGIQGTFAATKDDYRRVKRWTLGWSFAIRKPNKPRR